MRHDHQSFSELAPAKKAYSSPALTSTKLTEAEQLEASFSRKSMLSLGERLKAEGRI